MLRRRLCSWCPALATRGAHTAAAAPPGLGILEYRTYTLAPGGMRRYLEMVDSTAPVRRRLNPAWLGCVHSPAGGARVANNTGAELLASDAHLPHTTHSMFTAETGGVLNRVHHLYCYPSFAERASVRRTLSQDADWQRFIDESRPLVLQQARAAVVHGISTACAMPPS